MNAANVQLQYGTDGLSLDVTGLNANVIRPTYPPPLADERAAFLKAIRQPTDALPLNEFIQSHHQVAIAIPDITRALPRERLLTWLFEELDHVPAEQFAIISGTGTHRGHTDAEWDQLVGQEIHKRYRCIDHDAADESTLVTAGMSRFGYEVKMNRAFVEADRRILIGFIEPHFMAGYSGGYKACFPGVASNDAILHYHNAKNIGDPRSTWGLLESNPTQDHIRAGGGLLDHQFLINVTLDESRRITGFFCGDPVTAHEVGCHFCKQTAMQACDQRYPIVITTNSGYPLDQNLYQAVKGMSAASQIVAEGGLIIIAARCNDGFPSHGNFGRFLFEHDSLEAMLEKIQAPGFRMIDQWQVQILARIRQQVRVALFSELADEDVRRAHLEPTDDLRGCINEELKRIGGEAPIAVLPEGPLTIPYLVPGI